MKAYAYTQYGGPEVVKQVNRPRPTPKSNELLIRVHATTVSSGDWRARSLIMPKGLGLAGRLMFGVFGPRKTVLGTELAGTVESVGASVTTFAPGDRVVAYPGAKFGGHAEFCTIAETGAVAHIPDDLGFEEAASLPFAGVTALDFLTAKDQIKPGETVLVNGASGATGSAAVQIAKACGADVTAVTSARNADLLRDLGADRVIDYKTTDFARTGQTWDVIIDTVATAPWKRSEPALAPGGRLIVISGAPSDMLTAGRRARKAGKKYIGGVGAESPEHLRTIVEMVATGQFKPVIDRVYPWEKMVDAHRLVDSGRKKGSVVVQVA